MTAICDVCNQPIELGSWPFCPHGRGSFVVVGDDIPGGQIFENGFSVPTRFDSHSAHRAALDKAGLQIAPRWVQDGKLTRWV